MVNPSTLDKKLIYKTSCLQLRKALGHLDYSYKKALKISLTEESLEDEEILETFEGLSSRFARSTDIFISKCLKTYVLIHEPGFRGSLLDFLNTAHKLELIEDPSKWAYIRELRNSTVHEYLGPELVFYFNDVLKHTPLVLSLMSGLPNLEN